ncbi:acyl CoA:acetate/3-ketoacid CoA transferase beta subunit [Actinocorallia herbida]|uniref:Acyl CoA:acetate/3-ketoacid CoA transferase beta subunit n=1 Tax=Actinocorallia herbida TaxID=58109 RepID=A0A3N1CQD7_9ACTN|nr:CoA-transferase [Actinocorallia herbida]ROO83527.1 acyl CoA:acetate/3-ketoacid CoA transferase beta subunit [Actinocorallia herbida]
MGEVLTATRAEVCAAACADMFRGDGEIVAAAVAGMTPALGARLARATFEPGLLTTDGGPYLTAEPVPLGAPAGDVEGWLPFREHLWLVLNGRRHVWLGPSQMDRFGNCNISHIGPSDRPKSQLLGSRGAPGNTRLNPTSFWVPRHSTRVFVDKVDYVSGVGNDRGAFQLRGVVTNLAVLDFRAPDGSLRLRSVHPGVTVDDVVAATGFALTVPDEVPETRLPTGEELRLMREVLDPKGIREREVRA